MSIEDRCTSRCKDCEESYCVVSEDSSTQIKTKDRKRAEEWFSEIAAQGEEVFLMYCCHKHNAMVTLRHYLRRTHGRKLAKSRNDELHEVKALGRKAKK